MAGHTYSTALRNAQAQAIANALDANAEPGRMQFYTLPYPATPGAPITTQTLLGTCTLSKPCGTVADGTLTFDDIADDPTADHTGEVAFLRATDGAGEWVADFRVTLENGAGPMKMENILIYAGGTLSITSGSITIGNSSALTGE